MNLNTSCWYWAGTIKVSGYGSLWNGRKHIRAHRLVYEALIGPIPKGLVLDHLCKNKLCVNPEHLEPVTQTENMRRFDYSSRNIAVKTHCPKGHPLDRIRMHYGKQEKECGTCRKAQNLRESIIRSEKRAIARKEKSLKPHGNSRQVKKAHLPS